MHTPRPITPSSISDTPASPHSVADSDPNDSGGLSPSNMDKIGRRIEKAIIPQLASVEDKLERLASEFRELKRAQELSQQRKVDKDEFQLLAMRMAEFERFNPKQMRDRMESAESQTKYNAQVLEQLSEQIKKLEGICAHRTDISKLKIETASIRTETHKLQGDQKEVASSIFNSNRQISVMVQEVKTTLENSLFKLEKDKAGAADFANLLERLIKVERCMCDSRSILNDTGGQEINSVVKRVILNMEDKIMLIEKKIDAIAEGRQIDADVLQGDTGAALDNGIGRSSQPQIISAHEVAIQTLTNDLSTMGQAVQQLKQDINLSKADIEHISEKGHQQIELAERLNVLVEGTATESGTGEGGTALSLNRVQVMVAAAARQLVAGSKWITKETFDLRINEVRKEYLGSSRQLQIQIEDVEGMLLKIFPSTNATGGKPPKGLIKKVLDESTESIQWQSAVELPVDKSILRLQKDRVIGSAPGRVGTLAGPPGVVGALAAPLSLKSPRK